MSLYSLLGETFAFYEPEFMAITDEQYKAFVSEVPALEQYGHYFDRLLEKKEHVLSQKKRNYLQVLVRSLRLVVKLLKFWTMQILFSQLCMMTRAKKFN